MTTNKLKVAYIDDSPLEPVLLKGRVPFVNIHHFFTLNKFLNFNEKFDLIVIDINLNLNTGNGFEVYSQLKHLNCEFILTSSFLPRVDMQIEPHCVLVDKKELHDEIRLKGADLDIKHTNRRRYGRMLQSYLGDLLFGNRYSRGGLQIQSSKPSICPAFKSNASRSFKQKLFGCNSRMGEVKGRRKCPISEGWHDPIIHDAQKLRVHKSREGEDSGSSITGCKNSSKPVKKVSILPLPNYVGRTSVGTKRVQSCRLAYYLPPCNHDGHGILDEVR